MKSRRYNAQRTPTPDSAMLEKPILPKKCMGRDAYFRKKWNAKMSSITPNVRERPNFDLPYLRDTNETGISAMRAPCCTAYAAIKRCMSPRNTMESKAFFRNSLNMQPWSCKATPVVLEISQLAISEGMRRVKR